MPAEYLACPKCGNRVDEVDGEEAAIPGMTKRVEATGQWGDFAVFIHCPHCGTVLGVLPTQQT